MNTQEAYRQLDLAQGLDFDRVQTQYTILKTGLSEKITKTSNAALKDVYQKRLDEVEQAYKVLAKHFNQDISEYDLHPEESTDSFTEDTFTSTQTKEKKSLNPIFLILGIVGAGIVAIAGIILAFIFLWPEEDPFRIQEGEQRIFVSSLNLREYPDDDASKIGSFPTGTRFVYDLDEEPVLSSNFTWRKVNVLHPVYGWGSDDQPNPYSGWMATASCGIAWVADTLKTQQLQQIFDDNPSITSSYRHKLVEYFNEMNYLGEWIIPDENDESSYKPVVSRKNGLSEKDCDGDRQRDLFVVLQNVYKLDQKILIMYLDSNGDAQIYWDMDFPGEHFGISINRRNNKVYLNRTNPSSDANWYGDEIWFQDGNYYIRNY